MFSIFFLYLIGTFLLTAVLIQVVFKKRSVYRSKLYEIMYGRESHKYSDMTCYLYGLRYSQYVRALSTTLYFLIGIFIGLFFMMICFKTKVLFPMTGGWIG